MTRTVDVSDERWPIAGAFTISRASKTEAHVVVVEIREDGSRGRGECVPYPRYDETVESVVEAIASVDPAKLDRISLQSQLPPGAARNALDCALWDLEAKLSGKPASLLASCPFERPVETAYTISLDEPAAMAAAARSVSDRPILKLKLGGDGDAARIRAVRAAVPYARLIVDANESWSESNIIDHMQACAHAAVTMIEQPLPADADELLRNLPHAAPVCADESVHTRADLEGLLGKYDAVNVKLDKAGGLTEGLALIREARALGFTTMVGCMVGTSLSMAPAMLLAQYADFVDLDGPLLLSSDRRPRLTYVGSLIEPPTPDLWG